MRAAKESNFEANAARLVPLNKSQAVKKMAILSVALAVAGFVMAAINHSTTNANIDSRAKPAATPATGSTEAVKNIDASNLKVDVQSSSTSSSDTSQNKSSTTVTVNGQSVPVDQSGSVHKTFTSSDGSSSVNISIDNQSSTSSGQAGDGQ